MISLSGLLSDLSAELGVEIYCEEHKSHKTNPYSLRFAGLDSNKSFELVISRSWKTTQVRLQPDSFAGDVIQYLCTQINKHSEQITSLIESNESNYSAILLEIDGRPFFGKAESVNEKTTLAFEVETLTSESSIEYGLLNSNEEKLCRFAVSLIASILPIEKVAFRNPDEVLGFPEGAVSQVLVNKYERDPRNRREAISIHGHSCMACGFNFKEKYGQLGDEYIIVHHVVPVSQMGNDYVVDPAKDLVTLCANCHAMVHRQDPPMSVDDLKQALSIS